MILHTTFHFFNWSLEQRKKKKVARKVRTARKARSKSSPLGASSSRGYYFYVISVLQVVVRKHHNMRGARPLSLPPFPSNLSAFSMNRLHNSDDADRAMTAKEIPSPTTPIGPLLTQLSSATRSTLNFEGGVNKLQKITGQQVTMLLQRSNKEVVDMNTFLLLHSSLTVITMQHLVHFLFNQWPPYH
jgi:hypothetical protein